MGRIARVSRCTLLALVLLGGVLSPAWALIVPLLNKSTSESISFADGTTDDVKYEATPGDFLWAGLTLSEVVTDNAWDDARFDLYVAIDTTCINVQGTSDGLSYGTPIYHEGHGMTSVFFTVNETQEYVGSLQFTAHDLPGPNHWMWLTDVAHHAYWIYDAFGTTPLLGRIPPGSYWVEGALDYSQTTSDGDGTSLSFYLCFQPCTSIISQQPQDVVAAPGTTIDVGLTPSAGQQTAPAGAAQVTDTYQWRKDLVNLVDDGRISGTTTDHLTITSATYADSGLYDCVVTQGTIVEPSREAHVVVQQTAGVDPSWATVGMSLAMPRPNPFFSGTRVEFSLAREMPVSLAVYDAIGRRVKTLMPLQSMAPGRHVIDWDGTDATGAHVASSVYFIQLATDGARLERRAILIRAEK